MTEDEAVPWLIENLSVSRETIEKLDAFRSMVVAANLQQNLVSAGSLDHFWVRHIVDSAQLLLHLGSRDGGIQNWLDLGTGAGFPGIVIAILQNNPITFVESRRRRIDFLSDSAQSLDLPHVTIQGGRLELMKTALFGVISARAFAPLPKLLDLAHRFSTNETVWLLPKGKTGREELESLGKSWQGTFHVKHSVTDDEAAILVARNVQRAKRR